MDDLRELVCGKEVVATGRFASMTHAALRERIVQRGGKWRREVTQATRVLVVGDEGPPVNHAGRLTRNFQRAQAFRNRGGEIEIVAEDDFLRQLGSAAAESKIQSSYSLLDLSRVLRVPGRTVRAWLKRRLIEPADIRDGLPFFDYRQAAAARSICALLAAGVSLAKLREALARVESLLPGRESLLTQVSLLENTARLAVRRGDGRLMQLNGQLLLDLQAMEGDADEVLALPPRIEFVEDLFEAALAREDQRRWREAVELYHRALQQEPDDAVLHFNLGNVLFAMREHAQAAECYLSAVKLDPGYAEAWNNLGNAFAELDRWPQAIEAFECALAKSPGYPEAHFNLAETHFALGQAEAARRHWRQCLENHPSEPIARTTLERLRSILKSSPK
jgi:tetratricopeptide (TPR) repeat protein